MCQYYSEREPGEVPGKTRSYASCPVADLPMYALPMYNMRRTNGENCRPAYRSMTCMMTMIIFRTTNGRDKVAMLKGEIAM